MKIIDGISDSAYQQQRVNLSDGSSFVLTIRYIPQQAGWFIESLTYNTFTLNGFRISTSPNMLHQYRNVIPFGLACITPDNFEPTQQKDFLSGYAKFCLLSEDEVTDLEGIYSG